MNHKTPVILALFSVTSLQALPPAAPGQIQSLEGYILPKKASGGSTTYWLSETPVLPDTNPIVIPPGSIRLTDGPYPRSLSSIFSEYGTMYKVEFQGVLSSNPGEASKASQDLKVHLMKPGMVPYVPSPQKATEALIDDQDVLVMKIEVSDATPRNKLLVRHGYIRETYPASMDAWVEIPDPHTSVSNHTRIETFTLDLKPVLGNQATYVSVLSGRDGYITLKYHVGEKP